MELSDRSFLRRKKGELQEDEHELISVLHDLVSKYEAPDSGLQDVDAEFLAGMNKVVQGCKIKINKIEGKAKLKPKSSIAKTKVNC